MSCRCVHILSVAILALVAVVGPLANDASAGKNKRKRAAVGSVNQAAVADIMGRFDFGMTKGQVLSVLGSEVDAQYKERLKETIDVYVQDKLRRQRDEDLQRIESSHVDFAGKRTGWDVSIIDDQFHHNTDESMMVYWENKDGKDQRRFFFFFEGKLYKMLIALNSKMLKGEQRSFAYFKEVMEQRYGTASIEHKTNKDKVEVPHALVWRTDKFLLAGVDKLEFYGSFVLVISDPQIEKAVAAIRASTRKETRSDQVVDSVVTKSGEDVPDLDEKAGTIDTILKGD